MRILILAFLFVSFTSSYAQSNYDVLFTIDGQEVSVGEFRYIYEKNNAENADYSEKSLDEYLELYKKFKLKVRRAQETGLDTVKTLQDELAGYRKQLAKSYLKDKEIANRLINEVAERMQEDIEVYHIFVAAEPKTADIKKKNALDKINNIYEKLVQNNGAGFEDMAKTLSEDRVSASKGGRMGFYTSPLPDGFYEFENAMYSTEIGKFSKPVKSKMGYHIIKPVSKRKARGEMEIAHILVRSKDIGAKKAQMLVDSVYNLLNDGRNFENMAAKFSDDVKSKSNGGYLGYFGINQYEETFEKAAFDLDQDNTYCKPIKTNIGFHIIKRISKRDNSDMDRLKKRIQARINNNDRFQIAENKMIEDVKEEAGFKEDKASFQRLATSLTQDFYSYKWQKPTYEENVNLISIGNTDYNLNDFAEYAKSNVRERLKFSKSKDLTEAATELYDKFVTEKVLAYEEENLESKYPDFKSLMREYREGILLFEITKQEVWDKASSDTTGLKTFYGENKLNYIWPERVKVFKYTLEGEASALRHAYTFFQNKGKKKFLKEYEEHSKLSLKVDEEVFEKSNSEIESLELKKESVSKLSLKPEPAYFYSFEEMVEPTPKTLNEAKGYVIADYQDHLEKKWINELNKKYKIKVNDKVFKSLIK